MKKEIISVLSVFTLLVINSLFWNWFCWLWSVNIDNGMILVLAVINLIIMALSTAYFAQKYGDL